MKMLLLAERFAIGVLDLAAFYEKHGHEVDCGLIEKLPSYKDEYDVVGMSFFSFETHGFKAPLQPIIDRMEQLKTKFPSAEMWIGGRTMEMLPEEDVETLRAKTGCMICVGPGEKAIDGEVDFKTYPAWTEKHVSQMNGTDHRWDAIAVQSARGCPYACNFCHNPQPLRFFSPERTVENIRVVEKLIQFPMMVDDVFTIRADRMRAIREGLEGVVRYRGRMRFFTHVKHKNYEEIKRFDPFTVQIGIESGDDRMLKLMGKRITRAEAMEAVRKLYEVIPGRVVGLFLIGYPGETEESLENTLSFVHETKGMYKKVWASYYMPVIGTPGAEAAKKEGTLFQKPSGPYASRYPAYLAKDLKFSTLKAYRHKIVCAQ